MHSQVSCPICRGGKAPRPQGFGSHGSFMTGSAKIWSLNESERLNTNMLYSRSRLHPLKGSPT